MCKGDTRQEVLGRGLVTECPLDSTSLDTRGVSGATGPLLQ